MSTDSMLIWFGEMKTTHPSTAQMKKTCTVVSPESDAGKNLLELVQSSIADALKNSISDLQST